MEPLWYFAKDKKKFGPFTFDQLRQQSASGFLMPDDMVWYEGGRTWVSANTVPGLVSQEENNPITLSQQANATTTPQKKEMGTTDNKSTNLWSCFGTLLVIVVISLVRALPHHHRDSAKPLPQTATTQQNLSVIRPVYSFLVGKTIVSDTFSITKHHDISKGDKWTNEHRMISEKVIDKVEGDRLLRIIEEIIVDEDKETINGDTLELVSTKGVIYNYRKDGNRWKTYPDFLTMTNDGIYDKVVSNPRGCFDPLEGRLLRKGETIELTLDEINQLIFPVTVPKLKVTNDKVIDGFYRIKYERESQWEGDICAFIVTQYHINSRMEIEGGWVDALTVGQGTTYRSLKKGIDLDSKSSCRSEMATHINGAISYYKSEIEECEKQRIKE